ncbi:hypothetical protein F5X98DRAFT_379151 [Xylaria grammica]|nr:hypothetical protein F5X98DRAFT_379151 [Xylaria grammica]
MEELKGKTALVTGASMGIGEAIGLVLAKAGCNVVLLTRSKEPLVAEDLEDSLLFMLSRTGRVSIKALDCVPAAQGTLTRIGRTRNERRN